MTINKLMSPCDFVSLFVRGEVGSPTNPGFLQGVSEGGEMQGKEGGEKRSGTKFLQVCNHRVWVA